MTTPDAPELIVTVIPGLEDLLARELTELGVTLQGTTVGAVRVDCTAENVYRTCLGSHLASRVLWPLQRFSIATADDLYREIEAFPLEEHFTPDCSFAVDVVFRHAVLEHSRFALHRVKDAVADRFRRLTGERPSVDRDRPQIRLHLFVQRDEAQLSLDLSGAPLHQRGYRKDGAAAPLRETLAAAILRKAGWPGDFPALVDPLCGSGTLVIEAGLMATRSAPGLLRAEFGFDHWQGHDPALWQQLRTEAMARRDAGRANAPILAGSDHHPGTLRAARENGARAGLGDLIQWQVAEVATVIAPAERGLLVANPPYGERLGDRPAALAVHRQLGEVLRTQFDGWHAAIITGDRELGFALGLRADRVQALRNGPLDCQLLHFAPIRAEQVLTPPKLPKVEAPADLVNRLRKNRKALQRWAGKNGISCYRLYDADLPEYAVAVDLYGDRVHLQEYAPPAQIPPETARARLDQAVAAVCQVLELPAERLFLKVRSRQKGLRQYERQAQTGEFFAVEEGGSRLLVNLADYLDTGLFLDHRPIRLWLHEQARGKRFLNLFGYTGAATVHAAAGGARSSCTVDLSSTYLDWARRNLAENGLEGPAHRLVRADARLWLERCREQFDLIFLDPPVFSNSKGMEGVLDIQRDHVALIRQAMRCLAPGGTLIFSTNLRRFRLAAEVERDFAVRDISAWSIPQDFARNRRIHQCWLIGHPGALPPQPGQNC